MTFPDRPLNPPHPSPALTAERNLQARQTLAFEIQRKCQDIIQLIAMVSSDDNLPDDKMTGEYFQNHIRAAHKGLLELDVLGTVFCAPNDERLFWSKLNEGANE